MESENEVKQRKVERTQFYWTCPKCEQEIRGNGKKTLEHLKKLHEERYCETLKEDLVPEAPEISEEPEEVPEPQEVQEEEQIQESEVPEVPESKFQRLKRLRQLGNLN